MLNIFSKGKELNSEAINLGHQHGRYFTGLVHQYGRRYGLCKLSTPLFGFKYFPNKTFEYSSMNTSTMDFFIFLFQTIMNVLITVLVVRIQLVQTQSVRILVHVNLDLLEMVKTVQVYET